MFRFKNKTIVVKPAMVVLITSIIAAVIIPAYLSKPKEKQGASFENLNSAIWKFEVRRNAKAVLSLVGSSNPTPEKSAGEASYKINMRSGVEVDVKAIDGASDCIDLRNIVNFDGVKEHDDLVVRFRARAEKPHDVFFILREYGQLIWSTKHTITDQWQDFSMPISFRKCKTFQAVLSIHLGAETGKLTLTNLRIEPLNPKAP